MNRTARSLPRGQCRQRGLGLVELMVALIIGLFLLLVMGSVFLNMKQAFTSQDQLAQLQDSERLALTVLTTTVQASGYFPDPLVNTAATDLPAATGAGYGSFLAGQGVVGLSGTAGASDTITSRYMTASGDGIMDCLGNVNPITSGANKLVMNTFTVSAAHELLCSTDGGTTTTPLVSGVTSLKVLYATDTAGDGKALQYLDAATVTSHAWWPQVHTAQITITMANPFASQAGQPAGIDWTQIVNLMNKS
ncbi:PilW family protein [Variovorax sp. EL159]|uniref:PilW family protein n=1 Tax=Variovorax sp. EL159 TaxID=1566270 RepID=UPI00088997A2|nr:PilW family protein [Variovorax sp. EL159]SCX73956.1 type IV pilus assembly protein PilW [Variovorax sp. EL159]